MTEKFSEIKEDRVVVDQKEFEKIQGALDPEALKQITQSMDAKMKETYVTKRDLAIVRDTVEKKLSDFDRMTTRLVTDCINTSLVLEKSIAELKCSVYKDIGQNQTR